MINKNELDLKSREEILLNLKEMFWLQRISNDKDMQEKVETFLWILNSEGHNGIKTERRLDEVLKKEGLDYENSFKNYWDY